MSEQRARITGEGTPYFAYGSNMSTRRFEARVGDVHRLGPGYVLRGHALAFDKVGRDGSGKCRPHPTGDDGDAVLGVLYRLDDGMWSVLDAIEGAGRGYERALVSVHDEHSRPHEAWTYLATDVDPSLLPFAWYLEHVVRGAREAGLPGWYVDQLVRTPCLRDPDGVRAAAERAVHG